MENYETDSTHSVALSGHRTGELLSSLSLDSNTSSVLKTCDSPVLTEEESLKSCADEFPAIHFHAPEKEPQQGSIAQEPLLDKSEQEQGAKGLELNASGGGSERSDSTQDSPAMDVIPVGDSSSPLPQPEDDPLSPTTLTQIAALSEQARELEKLAMGFTGEAEGKEYLFFFCFPNH